MSVVHVGRMVVVTEAYVICRQIVHEPDNDGNAVDAKECRPRINPVVTPTISRWNLGMELVHARLNGNGILYERVELRPILMIGACGLACGGIGCQGRSRHQEGRGRCRWNR